MVPAHTHTDLLTYITFSFFFFHFNPIKKKTQNNFLYNKKKKKKKKKRLTVVVVVASSSSCRNVAERIFVSVSIYTQNSQRRKRKKLNRQGSLNLAVSSSSFLNKKEIVSQHSEGQRQKIKYFFFFFKRRPNVWWSSPIEYSIYYVGWYGRKRVIKPFRHFSSSSSLNLRRASETCVVVVAPETEKYKTHKRFLNKKKFFFFSSFILNILLKFLVQ